ncbi:suppressor of cytokine signaling 2-like [Limulus polyphemus]|uniref:Suppressor of cytokine signaling 2-like n=1 Tax=Limulus polyphemus TaxID=6850 RepID=A0ABM1C1E0_LIMPO|nr:suppressor of cytokine signaling 2-like [Limulus polyphemus]
MLTKHVDPAQHRQSLVLIRACTGTELMFELPSVGEKGRSSENGHQGDDVFSTSILATVPAEVATYKTSTEGHVTLRFHDDFQCVKETIQKLKTCGYYYESLSWQQASNILQNKQVGTFLLRDSANPRFLFAVSVQTERGPTSVRIHYSHGQFRLDCPDSLVPCMPLFECVLQLVEYFVRLSQSVKAAFCVWLDDSGQQDVRVRLYRPLYKHVLSLQHLCRLTVNQRLQARADPALGSWLVDDSIGTLELPKPVKAYLRSYPYLH